MKNYLLLLFILVLASCQTDNLRKQRFAGAYVVTVRIPDAEKAQKDSKKKEKESKKEVHRNDRQAKKDVPDESESDGRINEALDGLAGRANDFANALAGLGQALGELGASLGNSLLDGLQFQATFNENGEATFGKKDRLRLGSGTNSWDIVNGKFYLWEDEEEKMSFDMKDLGNGKWELTSKKIIFLLERKEN